MDYSVRDLQSDDDQQKLILRVQALETWLRTTNAKLTQVNGQRKYGGPPQVWDGPAPGAHCEVFISQIPRDTYEDLLIPLFSSVGPLWEFRLMMNFSGQNRGFAYCKYGSPDVANEAIRLLHGYTIEPTFRLNVRRSTEKRHLCIGDLPATTKQEALLKVLHVLADGVERVSLKAGPGIDGVSAMVAFSSHHAASMAKKMLVEAFKKQFSLKVSITWQSTHKRPPSLLPPPQKPPRLTPSALPPRMARPPSFPQGFCRAVGGPAVPQHSARPSSSPSPSQGRPVSPPPSPVTFLHELCKATAVGQPLYKTYFSHAGPDGFLFFNYKVHFTGAPATFEGLVMILPGPSATSTLEEAQRAAAQQVLQRLSNNQLAP
uniref:RRM domain-containing protein n=1 Tax=Gasterosteus aculeatus aculeatus TaxID=481459 RepID=A0AAQ4Q7R2_GASAC